MKKSVPIRMRKCRRPDQRQRSLNSEETDRQADDRFELTKTSPRRHRGAETARIDLPVEPGLEFLAVELALPPGDHYGGEAIAADVGERPTLAHELVDTEYDRHAGNELRPHRGERRGECDEARASDAASSLRGEHCDYQNG